MSSQLAVQVDASYVITSTENAAKLALHKNGGSLSFENLKPLLDEGPVKVSVKGSKTESLQHLLRRLQANGDIDIGRTSIKMRYRDYDTRFVRSLRGRIRDDHEIVLKRKGVTSLMRSGALDSENFGWHSEGSF